MRITNLKPFFSRLLWFPRTAERVPSARGSTPLLDFDPFWHGDHWQNLLASPMDARHYVMEDWTVPASEEFDTTYSARSKDRRDSRRRN
jgi:hypothetical protein